MDPFVPPNEVDEYRLVGALGKGGMGQVYLGHDTLLDRPVAVKFIATSDPRLRQRLMIEARAIARLHHPNVVSIYRIGSVDGYPYLVSEFVRGETLDKLSLPLQQDRIIHIASCLAQGLRAAHRRGVLHRDIKPANIILTEEGEAKLLDFGLARFADQNQILIEINEAQSTRAAEVPDPPDRTALVGSSDATVSLVSSLRARSPVNGNGHARPSSHTPVGSLLGTPRYMAPEIWRREESTFQSDIYSFGVVLFELATGRPPHDAETLWGLEEQVCSRDAPALQSVAPHLDPRLAAAINRCLCRDPAGRFSSTAELCDWMDQLRIADRAVAVENPYRGLRPFQAEHRGLFFGRSAHIRAVVSRLREDPMVLVTGDSGVGKSSLCHAGVVPALEAGNLGDGRTWRAVSFSPGRHPMLNLAGSLAPLLSASPEDVAELLRLHPSELSRAVLSRLGHGQGLVLFIDQLEELVTQSDCTEAVLLGEILGHLSDLLPGIRVVMTVRGDFLMRLTEAIDQSEALSRAIYLLPPLSAEELRECIVAPARTQGVSFESDEMVQILIQATSRAVGGLPLLQFTLAELWAARDAAQQVIRASALSQIGGVSGALARHADGVLACLSAAQQTAARRVLTKLVSLEGARLSRTRCELLTGDPSEPVVLDALVRGRILVARDRSGVGPVYDLAHEALLQGWTTLRDWLSGDSNRRRVRDRIELAAAEWQRSGQAQDMLLGDRRLAEVEVVELDLSELAPGVRGFLRTSQKNAHLRRRRRLILRWLLVSAPTMTLVVIGWLWQHNAAFREAQDAVNAYNLAHLPGRERDALVASIRLVGPRLRPGTRPPALTAAALTEAVMSGGAVQPPLSHPAPVRSIAFVNDGTQLLTASDDGGVRLWDVETGQLKTHMTGHRGAVLMAVAPGSPLILTAGEDRIVRLWNVGTGQLVRTLSGHTGAIRMALFSPDGTLVLSASDDHSARIWRTKDGATEAVLSSHPGPVHSAQFSPDGRRVITTSVDAVAHIWDAATGERVAELKGHTGPLARAVYSPDGQLIATTSDDMTVRLWGADGSAKGVFTGHTSPTHLAAFSPDGHRLVTTGATDISARLWDVASQSPIAVLAGHSIVINAVAFSPDGTRIVTASRDHNAWIFEGQTGAQITCLKGHGDSVTAVSFSPDGSRVATASDDSTARLWTPSPGRALMTLNGHLSKVWNIALSPDGQHLVSGSGDNTARLWDLQQGKMLNVLAGHTDLLQQVEFSPDGSRVITASWDGTARIWDVASGASLAILSGHADHVEFASFSRDGTRAVTAGSDGTVRLWDARSGAAQQVLMGHTKPIQSAAFSMDGRYLLSSSLDGTGRVWDAQTGQVKHILLSDGSPLWYAAYAPDGRSIITGSQNGIARLWTTDTGQIRHVLKGHRDSIHAASFSSDSQRVVTASLDTSAIIWDVQTGRQIAPLLGHTDNVWFAHFSPDRTRVVTTSSDHTARLWDAETGEALGSLRGHSALVYEAVFSPDGKTVATSSTDHTIQIFPATTEGIFALACQRLRPWDAFLQVRTECRRYVP